MMLVVVAVTEASVLPSINGVEATVVVTVASVVGATVVGAGVDVDAGAALVDVLLTSVVSVLLSPPPAAGLFHASQNVGSSSVPREQSVGVYPSHT